MIYITHSEEETEKIGAALAARLRAGDVVAMTGDLGAGKTVFIRGLGRALGVTDRITSPTYTVVNEYEGTIPLFHFDMYRLSGAEDLFGIGWDDYLRRGGVCAVEWSERAEGLLPLGAYTVDIARLDEDTRRISITGGTYADTCV
jgi:tRNA threonylcarbamoyladenosine biosynthesis protein TsaE